MADSPGTPSLPMGQTGQADAEVLLTRLSPGPPPRVLFDTLDAAEVPSPTEPIDTLDAAEEPNAGNAGGKGGATPRSHLPLTQSNLFAQADSIDRAMLPCPRVLKRTTTEETHASKVSRCSRATTESAGSTRSARSAKSAASAHSCADIGNDFFADTLTVSPLKERVATGWYRVRPERLIGATEEQPNPWRLPEDRPRGYICDNPIRNYVMGELLVGLMKMEGGTKFFQQTVENSKVAHRSRYSSVWSFTESYWFSVKATLS